MKALIFSGLILFTSVLTSCKSGDKCDTCPTFSKVKTVEQKEQI